MTAEPERGISKKKKYATACVLVILGAISVAFLVYLYSRPNPKVISAIMDWEDDGNTCVLSVTVQNVGASGNVKVFAQVYTISTPRWAPESVARFDQTQEKSVFLERGCNVTLTFKFRSFFFPESVVLDRAWTVAE